MIVYPVAFLCLAVVTGWAAASLRRWVVRLPLLVATPVLAVAVWWALAQRDGWPTTARPTDGSAFVAGVVQPPTPTSSGAIYLWLLPESGTTPRGYRLPYSRQLERKVAHASREARHGHPVGVRTLNVHRRAGHGQPIPQRLLRFYRLPPPGLQRKER